MGVTLTDNDNYTALSGAAQTLVDAAVVAIRAAFAEAGATADHKVNVQALLNEVIRLQEES